MAADIEANSATNAVYQILGLNDDREVDAASRRYGVRLLPHSSSDHGGRKNQCHPATVPGDSLSGPSLRGTSSAVSSSLPLPVHRSGVIGARPEGALHEYDRKIPRKLREDPGRGA